MKKEEYLCRCGRKVNKINSYFHKSSGMRITVCDKCADQLNLDDKNKYEKVEYKKLTKEQMKTPQPQ